MAILARLFVVLALFGNGFASAQHAAPAVLWAAERTAQIGMAPNQNPFVLSVTLRGSVHDTDTRRSVVDAAKRGFPLQIINDRMDERTGGITLEEAVFALEQLGKLQSGTVQIEGNILSIRGVAKEGDGTDVRSSLNAEGGMPRTLRVGNISITPRILQHFSWSVTKTKDAIQLDGFVPSNAARDIIYRSAFARFPQMEIQDRTTIAWGQPANFLVAARLGLNQLENLDVGVARLSGNDYSVVTAVEPSKPVNTREVATAIKLTAKTTLPVAFNTDAKVITIRPQKDLRSVDFLYATSRVRKDEPEMISFNHERSETMTYGIARVRIPDDHKIGNIELPAEKSWLWIFSRTEKSDPKRHFMIKSIEAVNRDRWKEIASGRAKESDALIFVHGYNVSFRDAVFRTAQIVWDLQYQGAAILFSWPSRGETLSYEYDRNSALVARSHFIELLKMLEQEARIKKVNIIAHSMGNFVVLDALANHTPTGDPLAIGQLIMAAPDIDRDQYRQSITSIGKIVGGMTLYASAADKAMIGSRTLAQGPRAGDVIGGSPTIMDGVDAIDVTAVGSELLGLAHDTFAARRSLINDIGLLLRGMRPPHARLAEIRRVPEGAPKPKYWRYVP